MVWLIVIVSLASVPLSVEMARGRERSAQLWFWIAFLVGPLAPLMLLVLGRAKRSVPAS
jgi:hypothetical protein